MATKDKVPTLSTLEGLSVKIRHQCKLYEQRGQDAQLASSLKTLITEYCLTVIQAIKEKSIISDPYGIVDNLGFIKGSIGDRITNEVMGLLAENDEEGTVSSLYMNKFIQRNENFSFRLKNGAIVAYDASIKQLVIVKGKMIKAVSYVWKKFTDFLSWCRDVFMGLFISSKSIDMQNLEAA